MIDVALSSSAAARMTPECESRRLCGSRQCGRTGFSGKSSLTESGEKRESERERRDVTRVETTATVL